MTNKDSSRACPIATPPYLAGAGGVHMEEARLCSRPGQGDAVPTRLMREEILMITDFNRKEPK